MHSASGRARLLDRVWGEVSLKQARAPVATALLVILGVIIAAVIVLTPSSMGPHGVGGVIAVLIGIGSLLIQEINSRIMTEGRARRTPLPGKPPPQLRLAGSSSIMGTVSAGEVALSPLSYTPAVAFSITLGNDERRSDRALPGRALIDSATVGFTITTAEGDSIEIPRGRIEVISRGKTLTPARGRVDAYLREFDPLRRSSDDEDPFEHHRATELVIRIGDRVALYNPIKRKAFATVGFMGGYRDPVRQIFAVKGTPCIELLP